MKGALVCAAEGCGGLTRWPAPAKKSGLFAMVESGVDDRLACKLLRCKSTGSAESWLTDPRATTRANRGTQGEPERGLPLLRSNSNSRVDKGIQRFRRCKCTQPFPKQKQNSQLASKNSLRKVW